MKNTFVFPFIILFVIASILNDHKNIAVATEKLNSESIFISTDRNLYIAGEYLYFKFQRITSSQTNINSGFGYIVLRSETNQIIEKITLKLNEDIAFGSIYIPDTLQTGIYQLIGFTSWMKNFSVHPSNSKEILIANRFDEELNYLLTSKPLASENPDLNDSLIIQPEENSLPKHKSLIRISSNDSVFSTRSKIEVDLQLIDLLNKYELSISVARKNALTGFENSVIDFGNISVGSDFSDNLNLNTISFLPEKKDLIVSGKVINSISGEGIKDIIVLLTTPDTILNLQYSKTLNNGNFHFNLSPYYYSREVYFSIHPDYLNPDLKIQLFDKFDFIEPFRPVEFKSIPELKAYIKESQNIIKVQKAYKINYNLTQPIREQIAFPPLLFSNPALKILLSDYFPLDDFTEISRELIIPLRIRQNKDEIDLRLVNQASKTFFNKPPIVFLDGIVLRDFEQIMPLGSEELNKIEIHNLPWVYGELEFPGIIGVYTTKRNYSKADKDDHISFFAEKPINPSTYFSNITKHSQPNFHINEPDFRQLLYWNPSILLSADNKNMRIEFYSSDIKGDFIIKIDAISSQGSRISESKIIKVK
jgi:hypothetical protein